MKCLSLNRPNIRDLGAKPFEPFGERLECRFEGGNTGRRTHSGPAVFEDKNGRPFSSRPGSIERAVYRDFGGKGKPAGAVAGLGRSGRPRSRVNAHFLQAVSEFDREIDALAHLTVGFRILAFDPAHEVERVQKPLEIDREQLLAKRRIVARAHDILAADQFAHRRHLES
jgi:hypothetical protein